MFIGVVGRWTEKLLGSIFFIYYCYANQNLKTMKKTTVLFLLTLILGIFFASCTKDDSGPVGHELYRGKMEFQ